MYISILKNILDADRLSEIRHLIDCGQFVDGRLSAEAGTRKNNLELANNQEHYAQILEIVELSVRENVEFNMAAFPRYMTRPIISRYDVGMSYEEHVDAPVMGFMAPPTRRLSPIGTNYVRSDLSMTLFLSPPDSYEGGELTFDAPTGPVRIKLDSGNGILYPTGIRHSVTQVTKGVRLAAIFWIQTMFPVESHRKAIIEANRLVSMLRCTPDAPTFLLAQENFFNLCRLFAVV